LVLLNSTAKPIAPNEKSIGTERLKLWSNLSSILFHFL
jgi:hypothetical protein